MTAEELFTKHVPVNVINGYPTKAYMTFLQFCAALAEAMEGGHLQPMVSKGVLAAGVKNTEGLLPCPFCGGGNLNYEIYDIDGWAGSVKCKDCDDMIGPMSQYKYDTQDEARGDARKVWNKRGGHF